jgi:hypothetical protein
MVMQSEFSEERKLLFSHCRQDEGEVLHALRNTKRKPNVFVLVAFNGKPILEKQISIGVSAVSKVNLVFAFEPIEFAGF